MTTPVIGRYEVRSGLGRGAMGSVYLAFDPKMGREVAIKVLQREFAQSTKHRARFDREARAIAALRHPNIVEIYDYGGSPDDHLYLVMEFIAGPHVGKVVRDNGPFPESVLAAVGVELTAALGHAHQSGIIHRDLKPENVFIDKGRLVLADFGIVKAITSDNPLGAAAATPETDVIGTPGFMAPEQLVQDPLDARTDVFSLGSLMYYLATLKLPYDAESPYALLKEFRETRPTPLADVRPDLSDTISALVQDCLEVNQDFRPKDVEIVRRRLRQALDQLGARDAREILARFETNPDGFREQDKERTIGHLIEQLKIAVRDGDGILADGVRGRIGVLDPNNAEAQRITGAAHLSKSAVDTDPELVIKRGRRRQKVFWGGGLAVLMAALVGLVAFHMIGSYTDVAGADHPPISAPNESVSILRVRSRERTHVFLDGRALGATPDFAPAIVPSGRAELEFVTEGRHRLTEIVELPADGKVNIVVDWKHGKVRVRRTKTRAPSKKTRAP